MAKRTNRQSDPHTTPAMRQFHAFKEKHPDCVLFFRMGDFYETFYDDAVLCHKVLGITLTERTKDIPMAGVPYHSVENYLRRLIEAGYRVAVADQVQDPKEAKGIVERAVTRVITPGTLVDDSLLDDSRSNLVAAVLFHESGEESSASVAVAELSTGLFELFESHGVDLASEIAHLSPNELVFVETSTGEAPTRVSRLIENLSCALTPRPGWQFRHDEAREALTEHFGVQSLKGFGIEDDDPAIGAAGALVRYFNETQANSTGQAGLAHLRPPVRRVTDEFVHIDSTSLQSLEIERTIRGGKVDGSLLGIFTKCRTPMGKRLLRQWLCYPLCRIDEIRRRQRCVGAIMDDRRLMDALEEQLSHIQDVARIAGRVTLGRATPRDLVGLGKSLEPAEALLELLDQRPALEGEYESLQTVRDELVPMAERIHRMCAESPPAHMRDGGLFRDGVDAELDESRSLQRDANAWLADYQQSIIKETGIQSLKVGYNKVFGYYIEASAANSSRVPDTFTRKQTLKNAERYITPELKEFETKVLHAEERAVAREQKLFADLCDEVSQAANTLAQFADTVAAIDVYFCFAHRALQRAYVRPEIVDDSIIEIEGGRHPVLDELLRDQFVPNDCALNTVNDDASSEDARCTLALITGPNMAGKSTYIRQVALLTLLAHTGSYVPAERARIGMTDRVFTRIGASDELHAGRSTFMVEMTETANILHHATGRSLVVLDEIGRGTSTLDGLSLAWAIAECLASMRTRTLFATHYHELTTMSDRLENVCNLHVAVREWADEIVFLYRILPGRTDRSYGIHVAKIAGLPTNVVQRANELLATLEVQTERADITRLPEPADRCGESNAGGQLPLFTEYIPHPVVDELQSIEIERLSPLEAFDLLRRLKGDAGEKGAGKSE